MQEGRAASQIANDKKRLFNFLRFMSRKKDIVQKETDPVDELTNRPDRVEHQEKDTSFACQTGGSIPGGEEGAISGSPEEAEIWKHSVWDPYLTFIKKARTGFLYEYSIRKQLFWIN